MYYLYMIPELFQSPAHTPHIDVLKSVIGFLIVLFASFVGVEIKLGKDDDET
tara:strand:- start:28 stop:183 length:156 start_codon:yes stop_codon:yes gene_type:complete